MQLALYKGPADGALNKLGEALVCIGTWSRYSHVELVTSDGWCQSSSYRDGGVRRKLIDLTSGKWDLVPIAGDEAAAIAWFKANDGKHYDWPGIVRFVLPFVPQHKDEYFCSEAVAAALGIKSASRITPQCLADLAHSAVQEPHHAAAPRRSRPLGGARTMTTETPITTEGAEMPEEVANAVLWRQVHSKRLDELGERQEEMQSALDDNTEATKRIEASTTELVAILDSWKGAMRVFDAIGKFARPLGYIASAAAAIYAFFHVGGKQ